MSCYKCGKDGEGGYLKSEFYLPMMLLLLVCSVLLLN